MKDDSKLLEENIKLREDVKMLENELKDLKSKMADTKGQDTGKINKDLMPDLDKSTRDDSKLLEENNKLKDKIKLLEKELQDLKSKDTSKKGKIEPADIEKGKKKDVSDSAKDYEQLLAENAKLKEKVKDQENELKNIKSDAGDKKEKSNVGVKKADKEPTADQTSKDKSSNELLQENKKLQGKIKSLEDDIKDLKSQITDRKERPGLGAEREIEDAKLQDENLKLSKANDLLNSKLKDINKKLNDEKSQNKDLQDENKKLTELLNAAEEAGGMKDDDIIKMYKENNEKLKNENAAQKNKIAALEKELDDLKSVRKKEEGKPKVKEHEKGGLEAKELKKETKTSPSGKENLLGKTPAGQTEKPLEVTQPIVDKKDDPKRVLDKSKPAQEKKDKDGQTKREPESGMKEGTKPSDKASPEVEEKRKRSKDMLSPGVDKKAKSDNNREKTKFDPSDKKEGDINNLNEQPDRNKERNKEMLKDTQSISEREVTDKKDKPTAAQVKKGKVDRTADRPKTGDEEEEEKQKSPETLTTKSTSPTGDVNKVVVRPKSASTRGPEITKPKTGDGEEAKKKKPETLKRSMSSSSTGGVEKSKVRPKSPVSATREPQTTKARTAKDGKVKLDGSEKEGEAEGKFKSPTTGETKKVSPGKTKGEQVSQPQETKGGYYESKPKKTTTVDDHDEVVTKEPVEKGKTKQMRKEVRKEKDPFSEKDIDEDETGLEKKSHVKDRETKGGKPSLKRQKVKKEQDDKGVEYKLGKAKELGIGKEETLPSELDVQGRGIADKDYDNLLNELKKKLNEAEKLIDNLKKENSKLKVEVQDLKMASLLKGGKIKITV